MVKRRETLYGDELQARYWGLRGKPVRRGRGVDEDVKRRLKLFLVSGLMAAAGLALAGKLDAALIVSTLAAFTYLVSCLAAGRWA